MADYTLTICLDERSKELVGEDIVSLICCRMVRLFPKGGYHFPSVDEEVDWDFYKCVLPIPGTSLSLVLKWNKIRDIPRIDILLIII